MKIPALMKLTVITKAEPKKSQDGKSTFYQLGIKCGSELGMMSCNETVYHSVEEGNAYEVRGEYNTDYKSLRLVDAKLVK